MQPLQTGTSQPQCLLSMYHWLSYLGFLCCCCWLASVQQIIRRRQSIIQYRSCLCSSCWALHFVISASGFGRPFLRRLSNSLYFASLLNEYTAASNEFTFQKHSGSATYYFLCVSCSVYSILQPGESFETASAAVKHKVSQQLSCAKLFVSTSNGSMPLVLRVCSQHQYCWS